MILGSNGIKMGKRYPEYVVNPSDIVRDFGADTLRLYEMFMGPLQADKPWSNEGVVGSKKFLDRVYRLFTEENKISDEENKNLEKIYNQTVKKVTDDYESLNINTAISQMMIFMNAINKEDVFPREYAEGFIKLLNPVCPHITEELWNTVLEHEGTITYEEWPKYDESKLVNDEVTIGVQINGKLRDTINISTESSKEETLELAKSRENIKKYIDGAQIIKEIVVPGKIVNIVIK